MLNILQTDAQTKETSSTQVQFAPATQRVQYNDANGAWEVVALTADEQANSLTTNKASKIAATMALRTTKLAAGFDYNFNDARGIHHIGTTDVDEAGWDKVSKLASALVALGQPTATISIVTDTGPTTVTAMEWQQILVAAGQFGQPLYQQSFTLEAEIAAATTVAALDAIDVTAGWPA